MNEPIDQADRRRFICELDRNFSVIAAAGSGKTRAITDRIGQVAMSARARELLPQLVVVAFTNRAADEMQQRARAEVLKAKVPIEVLSALNRAFFGTIHSFCVRLLESYGHHLGLPPAFEVITDDDEIWNDFVQQQVTIGRSLSEENRRELLRHVEGRVLMELGRKCDLESVDGPAGKCPDADFSSIYRHVAKGSMLQTIPAYQQELARAEHRWRTTDDYVRWPVLWSHAKDFVRKKREAFALLRRWIDQASLCVAAEVQRDYRAFRIERGLLTYDDQVALALELLKQPEIGREIRDKSFRVILDEAQDTDPRQFALLLELSRPPSATGDYLQTKVDPPQPGHFCMVGDFQQSIYRDRADLSQYRRIHNTLVETGAAEALKFSVTFRLDQAQLQLVNETFRQILNEDNQVAFVELNPRPQVLPGQVVRIDLQPANLRPDPTGKVSDRRRAAEEARQLGEWLQNIGPEKLRAQTWSEVAILCPRKEWLQTLRRGLRAAGLEVQIQSEKELKGDNPAYAWLTALLIVQSQPRCGYEIAGLLRELFGVSDHDLAVFANGFGDRFQIETFTNGGDVVSKTLRLLAQTRLSILPLPLFDAVNEAVAQTLLRERLTTLPNTDFEDLAGDLDALVALAAGREAERMSLAEFAEFLRTHYADPREVRPSRADSIQLITSQKAKGSEWHAVIVPFLTRDIRTPSPRYPRLLKDRTTRETTVLLEAADVTDEITEALEREQRQEMERLLYVALTRAQHTLVLAFDDNLFAKPSGEIHSHSQSKWLKADKNEFNHEAFAAMGPLPVPCAETQRQRLQSRTRTDKNGTELAHGRIDKNVAIQRASIFVRTLTPSGLPADQTLALVESRYAAPELPRSTSPALRYGLWWHQFAQKLDWRANSDSWNQVFEHDETTSPDPARSRREWKLLVNHLSSTDDFRRVCSGNGLAQSEMPLFWKVDDERCLEGVIDLALFDGANGKCLILDWKTDRVPPDSTETLHDRYLPQLAAYWKAVSAMTEMQVSAAIYSTAAGALVRYEITQLEKEWRRLEKLSPDQLSSTIKPDVDLPDKKPKRSVTQLEFTDL